MIYLCYTVRNNDEDNNNNDNDDDNDDDDYYDGLSNKERRPRRAPSYLV